jgi:hypothetical protein
VGTNFPLAKRPCPSQGYVERILDGIAATAVHGMRFGLGSELKAAGAAVHRMGFGLGSELKAAGLAVHRMGSGSVQNSKPPERPLRSASRPAMVEIAISGGVLEPMLSPIGRCTRAISDAGTPSSVSIGMCGPG